MTQRIRAGSSWYEDDEVSRRRPDRQLSLPHSSRGRAMVEQTTFVGPKRAAEWHRPRAVQGVAERSARVGAEMAEADRVYARTCARLPRPRDASRRASPTSA